MTSLLCERGLDGVQADYPRYQKIAYGVFLASRKLRHYFQEHPIIVVIKTPLSDIINKSEATGRVAKWGIELAAFEITYKRRDVIKSQALADFIADWTEIPDATSLPEPEYWVMHFDGSKLLNSSRLVYCYNHQHDTSYTTFCRSTSRL